MQIEYAKNPQWVDSEQTRIDLIVKFAEFAEEIPFTAAASGSEPHTLELYNAAVRGDYGTVAPIAPCTILSAPIVNNIIPTVEMRQMRLALLQLGLLSTVSTAIEQISDSNTKEIVKIEWEYATAIRKTDSWFQTLAQQMSIEGEELDNLFLSASIL